MITINHMQKQLSNFECIYDIIKIKKYRLMILGFGVSYAIGYMIAVGIISYVPGFASSVTTPIIKFYSIGISIAPFPNIFIFIFHNAIIFLCLSSFLIGLNIAMAIYTRKSNKDCEIKKVYPKGILGVFPAFFTSFSCCSTGLLAFVMGPTALSSLALYSQYMAPITIATLIAGTVLLSRNINNSCNSSVSNCCKNGGGRV